jgi:hypothetical protein
MFPSGAVALNERRLPSKRANEMPEIAKKWLNDEKARKSKEAEDVRFLGAG